MKRQRWIEYLDRKKLVFLTQIIQARTQTGYFTYRVTVPPEWCNMFETLPRVRVTLEIADLVEETR